MDGKLASQCFLKKNVEGQLSLNFCVSSEDLNH